VSGTADGRVAPIKVHLGKESVMKVNPPRGTRRNGLPKKREGLQFYKDVAQGAGKEEVQSLESRAPRKKKKEHPRKRKKKQKKKTEKKNIGLDYIARARS